MSAALNEARSEVRRTVVAGLPMPEFKRIKVTPITGAAGCEIEGVDVVASPWTTRSRPR